MYDVKSPFINLIMSVGISFLYILLAISPKSYTEASDMCVNPESVHDMEVHRYLVGNVFQTISDTSFMRCGKKCLKRRFCKSFNFDTSTLLCSLRNETSADSVMETSSTTMYSDINGWPAARLIGVCAGHNCRLNELCVIKNDAPFCRVFGCLAPPTVVKGNMDLGGQVVWLFEDEQPFTCDPNYIPEGTLTCLRDGTWSDVRCAPEIL